jgi:hypothetical protein
LTAIQNRTEDKGNSSYTSVSISCLYSVSNALRDNLHPLGPADAFSACALPMGRSGAYRQA